MNDGANAKDGDRLWALRRIRSSRGLSRLAEGRGPELLRRIGVELGQRIRDLIPRGLGADMDVNDGPETGIIVERAGGNDDLAVAIFQYRHVGAADPAEVSEGARRRRIALDQRLPGGPTGTGGGGQA